ncbi:hypothetical protein [Leucobacter japonicus]|uniref:hypothetical protein n=1 Tax=Leucobacter japonicus TaxID=1461259 RepID=UPI0006A75A54|nr:hypothetical protein [Leucobacter japonicus]
MVQRSNLIQIASDEWVVMREFAQYPKAIIRGMRDASGEARFILCSWHPIRHKQHMMGLFDTKEAAEKAVPWPSRNPAVPPRPDGGNQEAINAYRRRSGMDGNGYPPGSPDRKRADARRKAPTQPEGQMGA